MVKSGLMENTESPWEAPRVSPYRLATHLTGAFTIYTLMLWTTFSVMFPTPPIVEHAANYAGTAIVARAGAANASIGLKVMSAVRAMRNAVYPMAVVVAVAALSGAYVAGMDAGRAYNTFPLMEGRVVPEEYWAQWEAKGWRNFFENTAAVQFDHRVLAVTTLATVTAVWATYRGNPRLPPASRACLDLVMAVTAAQVALGISTLMYVVAPGERADVVHRSCGAAAHTANPGRCGSWTGRTGRGTCRRGSGGVSGDRERRDKVVGGATSTSASCCCR
jgi:cytochrome c oxidase assembly protein subunit 15